MAEGPLPAKDEDKTGKVSIVFKKEDYEKEEKKPASLSKGEEEKLSKWLKDARQIVTNGVLIIASYAEYFKESMCRGKSIDVGVVIGNKVMEILKVLREAQLRVDEVRGYAAAAYFSDKLLLAYSLLIKAQMEGKSGEEVYKEIIDDLEAANTSLVALFKDDNKPAKIGYALNATDFKNMKEAWNEIYSMLTDKDFKKYMEARKTMLETEGEPTLIERGRMSKGSVINDYVIAKRLVLLASELLSKSSVK